MSNGTYSASSRDATAKEVGQILDQVLNSANSKFGAKYVFSGFRVDSPAFARDGVYLGDDGAIFLQVGREKFNRVNLSGRELFEVSEEEQMTGRMSLIDSLKFFKDALERNEVHDIHRVSDELSFHQEKISSFQASIGAMSNTIDNIGQNLELMIDYEKKAISEIEDADMYQTTSNFKRTEAALQATLVASNKVLQPSLLNFFQ